MAIAHGRGQAVQSAGARCIKASKVDLRISKVHGSRCKKAQGTTLRGSGKGYVRGDVRRRREGSRSCNCTHKNEIRSETGVAGTCERTSHAQYTYLLRVGWAHPSPGVRGAFARRLEPCWTRVDARRAAHARLRSSWSALWRLLRSTRTRREAVSMEVCPQAWLEPLVAARGERIAPAAHGGAPRCLRVFSTVSAPFDLATPDSCARWTHPEWGHPWRAWCPDFGRAVAAPPRTSRASYSRQHEARRCEQRPSCAPLTVPLCGATVPALVPGRVVIHAWCSRAIAKCGWARDTSAVAEAETRKGGKHGTTLHSAPDSKPRAVHDDIMVLLRWLGPVWSRETMRPMAQEC